MIYLIAAYTFVLDIYSELLLYFTMHNDSYMKKDRSRCVQLNLNVDVVRSISILCDKIKPKQS